MPTETAADRLNRIVALVATLNRREQAGEVELTLADVAAQFGTTAHQIEADLRTLTRLGDDAAIEWLLSVRIWQEGDRIAITSAGPYRRPVRLSPAELLALQVALGEEPGGEALADKLTQAMVTHAKDPPAPVALGSGTGDRHALLARAVDRCRTVTIDYAGPTAAAPTRRTIQPHQLVEYHGRTYVIAWCELKQDWRHFRMDRMLAVEPGDATFTPRDDFTPVLDARAVFRESDAADEVKVRFMPGVARWIRERYQDHEVDADGRAVVTFRVVDADWLVRRVLQYGAAAEVVAPPAYRMSMRQAVQVH